MDEYNVGDVVSLEYGRRIGIVVEDNHEKRLLWVGGSGIRIKCRLCGNPNILDTSYTINKFYNINEVFKEVFGGT